MDESRFSAPDFDAQWATWSEDERCAWVYPPDGGINELRRLMKWVAQTDAKLHEAAAIYLDPQADLLWLLQGNCRGAYDAFKGPFSSVIPMGMRHSLRWQYFLIDRFLPLPELETENLPEVVREFDARLRDRIQLRVAIPTAHERLEAALNLRDWIRKNNAPATLLALL